MKDFLIQSMSTWTSVADIEEVYPYMGGTCFIKLKNGEIVHVGGDYDLAGDMRIGQGNRHKNACRAYCRAAGVTNAALTSSIKAERQRRADTRDERSIERIRIQAELFNMKLVPMDDGE